MPLSPSDDSSLRLEPDTAPLVTQSTELNLQNLDSEIADKVGAEEVALPVAEEASSAKPHSSPSDPATLVKDGVEVVSLSGANTGVIASLVSAVSGASNSLGILAPIGGLVGMGMDVLNVPWTCYKENRPPSMEEGIKLALCIGSIAFVAASLAVPPLAGFLLIGSGVGGVGLNILEYQSNKRKLVKLRDDAHQLRIKVDTHILEIKDLEQQLKSNPELSRESTEKITKQITELKMSANTSIAQYNKEVHEIHQREIKERHPIQTFSSYIKRAMSAVTLIGIVSSVFFPPLGLTLLAVAGLVSLGTLGISAVAKKFFSQPSVDKKPVLLEEHHPNTESDEKGLLDEPKNLEDEGVRLQDTVTASASVADHLEPEKPLIAESKMPPNHSMTEEARIASWHHHPSPIHHELNHSFNHEAAVSEEIELKRELHEEREERVTEDQTIHEGVDKDSAEDDLSMPRLCDTTK
jgi:hypothetical protein